MATPYGDDLCQKVITVIQRDGTKKSEATQVLQLSRNTVDLWLKRQAESGGYQAQFSCPPRSPQCRDRQRNGGE